MKIVNIVGENLHISANELKKFNEIFRKDVTYDNIKNHKKPVHHLLFKFLKKPQGGANHEMKNAGPSNSLSKLI